jgi:predicted AlkP superfamily phosphohydrolase/phosphomutase
MSPRSRPLIIIQCDAFDPVLTRRWMDEGALPTLAALRRGGAEARLVGPERVAELGMALSMYSGVSRVRHGYYAYRQLRPGTYDLYPAIAADAGVVPFWSSLTDRSVVTIDAGETMPVDGLTGVQLANWTAHQSATRVIPPSAVPASAVAEARRSFGPAPRIDEFVLGSRAEEDRPILAALLDRVRRKGELIRQSAARGADLIVAGFFEAHTSGHRFWKYHRGRVADTELSGALRAVYAAIDREIGELLAVMPDANVAIVSLYGMRDEYPTEGLMESFFRVLGYQKGPRQSDESRSAASGRSLTNVVGRMLPASLRTAISRRLPHATQERLVAEAFRASTDWTRTVAFSIPSLYTGHVRLNVVGREPTGVVEPGREYRDLLDRVEADLRALEDPLTGQPAVAAVHRTADLFGEAVPSRLPDLFVEWEPSVHFRVQVVHPHGVLRQTPPAYFRDSFHSLDGFVIAAGPDIHARGAPGAVGILDLAPTFLALLGQAPNDQMTGSVAGALLSEATS